MADLADVTEYLYNQCIAAVYPNGTTAPSIAPPPPGFTAPMDVRVMQGWPLSDQLDRDLGGTILSGNPATPIPRPNGPAANVSIFPLAGTSTPTYQLLNKTHVITPATFGLSVSVTGNDITITGAPNTGEFVTLICDRGFVYSEGGATASAILSALLADASVNYPLASLNGNTLTVPTTISLTVRQGGVGLLGKVTHRQCQYVAITVWAPNPNSRAVISSAIDVALKENIIITLPDGSDAKITYNRTTVDDRNQNPSIYRRDLVYEIDYATLDTFPGVIITSSNIAFQGSEYEPVTDPPTPPYSGPNPPPITNFIG